MADFRTIKTAMWREDDWFLDLETDAKLFWIYLFSNPSASVAGIYRLSLRTMSHETGLSMDRIRQLLGEFARANKAHFVDGVLWVVRMREHQETSSVKVQTRIKTDLAGLPKSNSVYRMYCARYGIDTVSIPIPTVTVTDTDTVTVCVTDEAPLAASQQPAPTTANTVTQGNADVTRNITRNVTPEPTTPPQTHTQTAMEKPPYAFIDRTDDQKAILRLYQDTTAQVITSSEKRVAWLDDMTKSAGRARMESLIADLRIEIQAGRVLPYNALQWLSESLRPVPGRNGKRPTPPPNISDMPDFGVTAT